MVQFFGALVFLLLLAHRSSRRLSSSGVRVLLFD
jgi:hypothetical protein